MSSQTIRETLLALVKKPETEEVIIKIRVIEGVAKSFDPQATLMTFGSKADGYSTFYSDTDVMLKNKEPIDINSFVEALEKKFPETDKFRYGQYNNKFTLVIDEGSVDAKKVDVVIENAVAKENVGHIVVSIQNIQKVQDMVRALHPMTKLTLLFVKLLVNTKKVNFIDSTSLIVLFHKAESMISPPCRERGTQLTINLLGHVFNMVKSIRLGIPLSKAYSGVCLEILSEKQIRCIGNFLGSRMLFEAFGFIQEVRARNVAAYFTPGSGSGNDKMWNCWTMVFLHHILLPGQPLVLHNEFGVYSLVQLRTTLQSLYPELDTVLVGDTSDSSNARHQKLNINARLAAKLVELHASANSCE